MSDRSENVGTRTPSGKRTETEQRTRGERRSRSTIGPWIASLAVFLAAYFGFRDEPILIQFQGSQLVHSAHSFNRGLGLVIDPEKPLAKFPPLYALLLAPLERLDFTVGAAAYLINALFLAISFVALAALGRSLGVTSNGLLLGAWALWAPNVYLLRSVRPDFIPIAMSLVAGVCLLRYARGGRGAVAALVGAAAASAVAALSRYMALFTLLPACALAVLAWTPAAGGRRAGGARRARDALLFSIVALGPVVGWLARNHLLTGYASGMSRFDERGIRSERLTLADNLADLGEALVLDGFSYASLGVRLLGDEGSRPDWWLAVVGALAAAALVALARHRAPPARPPPDAEGRRAARLCLGFVTWYLFVLVLLWTVGNNDPINTRYAAPVYPFALALAAGEWSRQRAAGAPGPAGLTLAAIGLALLPNAAKTVRLSGPAPNEQLIELRVWDTRPASWRHGIAWEDTKRVFDPRDDFTPPAGPD